LAIIFKLFLLGMECTGHWMIVLDHLNKGLARLGIVFPKNPGRRRKVDRR
jgi:hypothetical protein